MSEFFGEATRKTVVSLPVEFFEKASVYQQIFQYKPEQSLSTWLLKSNEREEPYYLLTGYSFLEQEIISITIDQAITSLEILLEKINSYGEIEINKTEVQKAVQNLLNFNVSSLDDKKDVFVQITNNLVIVLNIENKMSLKYELQIQGSEDITFTPAVFNFIGSESGDDFGEFYLQDVHALNLKSLHLLNEFFINMDFGQGNGMQRQYICIPIKVKVIDQNTTKIIFASSTYHLKNSRMSFASTKSANPFNIFDFIGRLSGFNVHIEGFEKKKQSYNVYMLVQNLEIENNSFGIGNIEFYRMDSIDDDILEMKSELKEKFQGECIAKAIVEAETPFDAYNSASSQIECALNALNFLVKQDSLYNLYSVEDSLTEWNRDLLVPKPTLTTVVNIVNNITGEVIIIDTNHIMEPTKLDVNENLVQKIEQLSWYEDIVTKVMDEESNEEIESVFNALKWLKRSWDASNIEDQIIFSNVTIEFLLSDEKVPPLMKKSLRKSVIESAVNTFKLNFDGGSEEKDKLSSDLKNKFSSSLTNAPLFIKLENLIQRFEIPFTEEDMKLLRKVRKARNDLVHGRGMEPLEKNELWKVNSIIGMLIAFKLKGLVDFK
ncbi:hypothetical protein CON30_19315 [Bacillus cereus]|nr:hypothetical protein CON30_19315 [Bacillus cereus]